MLIVAMTAMIGSIYLFCTTDRDRDHDELRDKELIYNKRVTDSMLLTNLLIGVNYPGVKNPGISSALYTLRTQY